MYEITTDIETTGLDVGKDTPIQLACTVHKKGELIREKVIYINPEKPLPQIITNITGITDEQLEKEGVSNGAGVRTWQNIINHHQPAVLIGYNIINFDFPMIQNWVNTFCRDRFKFPPICQIHDVMLMVCQHRKNTTWLKQADAAQMLGIEFDASTLHDALADIKLTREIYLKLMKREEETKCAY